MALEFPIISLNPSAFSFEPKNKSLVPAEQYSIITASCRETYEGEAYNYNVSYTNLSVADYTKVITFFDVVSTILPFKFVFEKIVYNALFSSPIKVTRELYNRYSITFSLETYFASLGKWSSLETNFIKSWSTVPAYPYDTIETNGSVITNTVSPVAGGMLRSNLLGLTPSSEYMVTVKPILESGFMPFLVTTPNAVPTFTLGSFSTSEFPHQYTEYTFVATSNDLYLIINNSAKAVTSQWSTQISLRAI